MALNQLILITLLNFFEKAEYNDILENTLVEDISIKETFSSLESIDELVNLIIENKEKGYPEMGIKGGTKEAEEEEERRSKEEDKKKKSSKN